METASSKYWPIRYWTKTASTVRQGAVYDLGADGCNEFTLQGDVYVELTVNLASYIFFQNPFYVGRDASGTREWLSTSGLSAAAQEQIVNPPQSRK